MTYSSYLSPIPPRILWVYLGTHLFSYCNELFPAANLRRVERGKLEGAKKTHPIQGTTVFVAEYPLKVRKWTRQGDFSPCS